MGVGAQPDAGPLVVVPSGGAVFEGARVLIDVKAMEGLSLYARLWPGPVRCLYRRTDAARMSYAEWRDLGELPFAAAPLSPDATAGEIAEAARGAALVLASADNHRDLGLTDAMQDTPIVLVIEYTLRTRLDILRLGPEPLARKLRTAAWLLLTERRRRRDLARAAGLQANGTPAVRAYGGSNAHPLLFFDTRLRTADFVGEAVAAAKARALAAGGPLTLVYSGRLEAMKGADHLVPIAARLKARGRTPFTLHVFGDGSLAPAMREAVAAQGLGDQVVLHGSVDFDRRLVPFLKSSADLFLCCHPQGDPACTYLETLGCGVPILGFRNQAFAGVLTLGPCGEGVAIGDRDGMAAAIERLDRDRDALAALTVGAARVASTRLFESVFAERVAHLAAVAGVDASA